MDSQTMNYMVNTVQCINFRPTSSIGNVLNIDPSRILSVKWEKENEMDKDFSICLHLTRSTYAQQQQQHQMNCPDNERVVWSKE